MKIFKKTFSYWLEKRGGLFLAIIVFCIIWSINPPLSIWTPFLLAFPTIGMCAFGFLLTFLGIILQGDSETIKWMMSKNKLYNRFIAFNKRIVIISFILSLYSYLIGYIDLKYIINLFYPQIIQNIAIGFFCGLLCWFIVDTILFIRMFYVLIRKVQ